MAVTLETSIQRFRGLSTDEKPGRTRGTADGPINQIPVGSVFVETDTGARYVWRGSWPWVRQEQTIEPLLERLIDVQTQVLETLRATQRGHVEWLWEKPVSPE